MNLKSKHIAANWRLMCVSVLCLLGLIQLANSATADPAQRVALVIGNAASTEGIPRIPVNDVGFTKGSSP